MAPALINPWNDIRANFLQVKIFQINPFQKYTAYQHAVYFLSAISVSPTISINVLCRLFCCCNSNPSILKLN
jgi:hypothetical protein